MPKQLFYNTGIPACIWFISRKRAVNGDRKRSGEILFIDAGEIGYMEDRTHRAFSDEDIQKIAGTYHEWRNKDGKYEDIRGFCKSANLEEIRKNNYILIPGRYVGIAEEEDDGIPFEEKMAELTKKLKEQIEEEKRLNEKIKESLKSIGFEI